MPEEKLDKGLAELFWNAKTSNNAEEIKKQLLARDEFKLVPVGRENNISTIRIGSDPRLALVERITNSIDAVVELEVLLNSNKNFSTPQEAVKQLWSLSDTGFLEFTDDRIREVAENINLSFHDSGISGKPTIKIADLGTGQHPKDFNLTLLSLNESNKVSKNYSIGTYGQGGSVTFGFSEYSIIISTRHPNLSNGYSSEVGCTIVYEEDTDPEKNILPRYVWISQNTTTPTPITFPKEYFSNLTHGTIITHINYDVQKMRGPFTTQAWQFFNSALFSPILPFLLSGHRKNELSRTKKPSSRVIKGNYSRLYNIESAGGDIELSYHDERFVSLGPENGSVIFRWWVIGRPENSSSSSDPLESYAEADAAISLTLNGQRHDSEKRLWIKNSAKLPFLYRNIIIQIDADALTPTARRELFTSTRERITESNLKNKIYKELLDALTNDEQLKHLNNLEKERALKNSTSVVNEKVKKRIERFIEHKTRQISISKGGNLAPIKIKKNVVKKYPPRNTDDTNLPNVPNKMEFNPSEISIEQGKRRYTVLELNAKNEYLPKHRDEMSIKIVPDLQNSPKVVSMQTLKGGKSSWKIQTEPTTPKDTYYLTAALDTANIRLESQLTINIVEPTDQNTTPADEDPTNRTHTENYISPPKIEWVYKEGWGDHKDEGMDELKVGIVTQDADDIIIFINRNLDLLDQALKDSRLSKGQVATRAERYLVPVACALWLQHYELQNTDSEQRPNQDYRDKEMYRLAEAVIVASTPDVELDID